MKKLIVITILFCFGELAFGSLASIRFFLFEEILNAQNEIPEAQRLVKVALMAVAKFRDKTPAVYYVVAGVKREAVSGELIDLVTALAYAENRVIKLQKTISDNKATLITLCRTPEKKYDLFFKKIETDYNKRKKQKQDKLVAEQKKMVESGKYTEEQIQSYFENKSIKEARAAEIMEKKLKLEIKKMLKEINRIKDSKSRDRRIKSKRRTLGNR